MEEAKKEKIDYRWKVLFRIVLYTLVFIAIYWFSVKLIHRDSVYIGNSSSGGLIPSQIYMANSENATEALFLIFIGMVIYYLLFCLELRILKRNDSNILKYVLLLLFEASTIYLSLQSILILGSGNDSLFSTLKLNSIFLELLRSIITFLPPLIFPLQAIFKFIYRKIKLYQKRKRIDKE